MSDGGKSGSEEEEEKGFECSWYAKKLFLEEKKGIEWDKSEISVDGDDDSSRRQICPSAGSGRGSKIVDQCNNSSASSMDSRQWSEDFVVAINQLGQEAINEMKAQAAKTNSKRDFARERIDETAYSSDGKSVDQEQQEQLEDFWNRNVPKSSLSASATKQPPSSRERRRRHSENPGVFSIRGRAPGSLPAWSRRSAAAHGRNRSEFPSTPHTSTTPSNRDRPLPQSQDSLQHISDHESTVPQAIEISNAEPVVYAIAQTISSRSFSRSGDVPQSKTLYQRYPKSFIFLLACILLALFVSLALVNNSRRNALEQEPASEDSDLSSPIVPHYFTCNLGDFPPSNALLSSSQDYNSRYNALIYLLTIYEASEYTKLVSYCTSMNRALRWLANDLDTWVPPPAFIISANDSQVDIDSSNQHSSQDIFVSEGSGHVLSNRTNSETKWEASSSSIILPDGCKYNEPCNLFGPLDNATYQILQRYGMAVLYFETFLPHWTNDYDEYQSYVTNEENWLSASHVCSWKYVNCSDQEAGEQNVTILSLSGLGLSGSLPLEIWLLWRTITMDVSNNRLTGSIPWTMYWNTYLENLHLENNLVFGNLRSLRYNTRLVKLTLQNNRLRGEIPRQFGSMQRLEQLVLSNNSIGGDLPPELGNLSSLELLDLRGNKFLGTVPSSICQHFSANDGRIMCKVDGLNCSCCTDCSKNHKN